MSYADRAFIGSIPDIFDSHMVPMIAGLYAQDMAARVASRKPRSVLQTAAGSGVVTRALAPRLEPDAEFVVSDLDQPMLDRAAGMQCGDERIRWEAADAQDLPFEDESFDAICCPFGVMSYADRVRGHREARRVLRPGGRYVFNVWDGVGANDFARVVIEAAAGVFPEDPPRFLKNTPYGHDDTRVHRAEVAEAGFRTVTISTVEAESHAESARFAAIAFCHGTPLRSEIEARDPARLGDVTDRVEEALARAFGPGGIYGTMRAHVIEAIA